jgi:hypothetical protein
MTIKDKLLVLGCLPLPKDIIYLISEYAFVAIEDRTRRQKADLIAIINERVRDTMFVTSMRLRMSHTFFWVKDDTKCPRFWFLHCRNCGDYINTENKLTPFLNSIICECTN